MIKRLLFALFTIFAALSFTFVLMRNMPGDIFYVMASDMAVSEGIPFDRALEEVRATFGGLDPGPLHRAYLAYIMRLFRGDLGESMFLRIPVVRIIATALPWTALVLSISIVLSFSIGSLLGMIVAWKRKTVLDPIVTAYASFTDATPDWITGLILMMIFAMALGWFPMRGAYAIGLTPGFNFPFILSVLFHAFLPIMAFTIENLGGWALVMKANAASVLGEDYIVAAQARGLKNRRIAISYVGRNAVLPPVTTLAIVFGSMLGGSALIETIFAYPGIGYFFAWAIGRRDYPLIQGLFLLTIGGVILANLLADLLYSWLDPRVELK